MPLKPWTRSGLTDRDLFLLGSLEFHWHKASCDILKIMLSEIKYWYYVKKNGNLSLLHRYSLRPSRLYSLFLPEMYAQMCLSMNLVAVTRLYCEIRSIIIKGQNPSARLRYNIRINFLLLLKFYLKKPNNITSRPLTKAKVKNILGTFCEKPMVYYLKEHLVSLD